MAACSRSALTKNSGCSLRKVLGSVMSVASLLVVYRLLRLRKRSKDMFGPLGQDRTREAAKGVYKTFAKTAAWWLEGQRFDTSVLYAMLGEAGIRELSTEFYQRVYSDTEASWFRDLFRFKASLQQSIDRQAAFFVQIWGGKKVYTANSRPHCLRSMLSDHSGAKMFAMHETSRAQKEITKEAAERWLYHVDATLLALRPAWQQKFGKDARRLEQTVRWFCDHVLERIVWGRPEESPLHPKSIVFRVFIFLHSQFVVRDLHYPATAV